MCWHDRFLAKQRAHSQTNSVIMTWNEGWRAATNACEKMEKSWTMQNSWPWSCHGAWPAHPHTPRLLAAGSFAFSQIPRLVVGAWWLAEISRAAIAVVLGLVMGKAQDCYLMASGVSTDGSSPVG